MLPKRKTTWTIVSIFLMLITALFFTTGCDNATDNPAGGEDATDNSPGCGQQGTDDGEAFDGGSSIDVDTGDNSCLDGITNYASGRGPFRVKRDTSGRVKMWVPDVPSGCKVPIVHLANGTGAMCAMYSPILNNLAEYGFLAICYENANTGQGTQAITAIETAIKKHGNIADPDKLGFTGHSQGGGATFTGVYRAEQKWGMNKKYSGMAIQPASGFGNSPLNWASMYRQIKSPMSMFNGTADILVYPFYVNMAYSALPNNAFKVWYTATGINSTHVPPPNGPAKEMSIPWFRWTLLGDSNACEAFKALPKGGGWRLKKSANVPECR